MINSKAMGKYSGIVIGVIAALLGIKGLIVWRSDLFTVMRGVLPAIFVLSGVIAVIAGLSEIKDEIVSKREEKR